MYARQPPDPRFPRNLRVPQNYSGNAFLRKEETPSEQSPPQEIAEESVEPVAEEAKEESKPVSSLLRPPGFHLNIGKLFSHENGFGIGFEELLIIGLILLISQNDNKDDLLFLLILLLFIG